MIKYILNYNLSEVYVLLGSQEEISLFCIEPTVDELFTIKKPNFIKNNIMPDAEVGMGGLPEKMTFGRKDDNNNLLLILSWGKIIYFYQMKISYTPLC